MSRVAPCPPPQSKPSAEDGPKPGQLHPADVQHEPRNFLVIALYQIVMRTGWIFKTESIIMPAVLDAIGGSAWLRGCLPMLNRFGHSIPPLLAARRVKIMGRKKWALFGCSLLMTAAMLAMASMWLVPEAIPGAWRPLFFLICYASFFVSVGVNQLSLNTLQGKLIRTTRRGRLLLFSNVVGATTAILFAWWLLSKWISPEGGNFLLVFGFAGMCFGISALSSLLLAESRDAYEQPPSSPADHFSSAWRTLRDDANFRRLAVIAALFGSSLMLFPHYQALGRDRMGLTLDHLILWVIIQNTGTALFSLLFGPLADRYGNRLVLRLILLGVGTAPLAAIALVHADQFGPVVYQWVFVFIGMTPITIKTLNNYTLEIAEPEDHPRYLGTLNLCLSAPIFLSPLLGLLIQFTNFETAFLGIAALVLCGWLISFRMHEPRHRLIETVAADGLTEGE